MRQSIPVQYINAASYCIIERDDRESILLDEFTIRASAESYIFLTSQTIKPTSILLL